MKSAPEQLTKLSIIIPAKNEAGCIAATLEHLHLELQLNNVPHEIVVVDDSSQDQTWQILEELSARMPELRPTKNLGLNGYGRAVIWGLHHSTGDAVVVMMADESDDSRDVVRYWAKLNEGYDCVFGSRFIRGGGVVDYPLHKLVLNRMANLFIQVLFRTSLNDTTNAFKAFRRTVIDGCSPLIAQHFNLTIEIPLKAIVRGYTWTTMPITWKNRRAGLSKLKIQEMGSRYLFICLYIWLEKTLTKEYRRLPATTSAPSIQLPTNGSGIATAVPEVADVVSNERSAEQSISVVARPAADSDTTGSSSSLAVDSTSPSPSGSVASSTVGIAPGQSSIFQDSDLRENNNGHHSSHEQADEESTVSMGQELRLMYRARFKETAVKRSAVWSVLVKDYFQRWIPQSATVLDLGAGFCEFINQVSASERIALDLNPDVQEYAGSRVKAVVADVTKPWPLKAKSVDVCFTSNFLEHLSSKESVAKCLAEAYRVLKDDGLLIVLGPNVRFCYDEYWDFFDHVTPLSERAVEEILKLTGFDVITNVPRFLPYTMQGSLPLHPALVRLYLVLPIVWPFFGKQFLLFGRKKVRSDVALSHTVEQRDPA
jgi:dolichol-phosphate mannosyltransferase